MKQQDSLEGLRAGFLSDNNTSSVTFKLKIIVDNITDNPYSGAAFCPVGPNSTYFFYWYLCPECLDSVTFSPQPVSDLDVKGEYTNGSNFSIDNSSLSNTWESAINLHPSLPQV